MTPLNCIFDFDLELNRTVFLTKHFNILGIKDVTNIFLWKILISNI